MFGIYQNQWQPDDENIAQSLRHTDSKGINFAPPAQPEPPRLGLVNIDARPTREQREQRERLLKYATTPIKGARGITANQMRIAQSLIETPEQRQADLAKTQANINAGLQKTALDAQQARKRQALDMARFGLQRQDQLRQEQRQDALQAKADAKNAMEQQQNNELFGLKKEAIKMQNEQARLGLYDIKRKSDAMNALYDAKTPDEYNKALSNADRLGLLPKQEKNPIKMKRPVFENGIQVGEEEYLVDGNTGQAISPQLGLYPQQEQMIGNVAQLQNASGKVALKRGQVVNGRRFLGGNPNDERNWD